MINCNTKSGSKSFKYISQVITGFWGQVLLCWSCHKFRFTAKAHHLQHNYLIASNLFVKWKFHIQIFLTIIFSPFQAILSTSFFLKKDPGYSLTVHTSRSEQQLFGWLYREDSLQCWRPECQLSSQKASPSLNWDWQSYLQPRRNTKFAERTVKGKNFQASKEM
jgi:hypothetical protein